MRHKTELPKKHTRRFLIQMIPPGSVCAEIGVMTGAFSHEILSTHPRELHLIDHWLFEEHTNKSYGSRITGQAEMDEVYDFARHRFADQESVFIHRKSSHEAAADFADEFFDFVYIDGNHSYDFIKKDMLFYLPKLKVGGLLAGDDVKWSYKGKPVQKAVNELKKDPRVKFIMVKNDQFIFKRIS